MIFLISGLFGLIQGLTEFIPVSSSGHLVILHAWLDLPLADQLAFDVALHFGTLLALVVYFWSEVKKYTLAWLSSWRQKPAGWSVDQRLSWLVGLSIVPAGLVGLVGEDILQQTFRHPSWVAITLVAVAILFFVYEHVPNRTKTIEQLSAISILKISLAQVLSLVPGVSRSGITIIAGLGEKLQRDQAARLSFLMAIPIVFLATVKKIYDLTQSGLLAAEIPLYIIGFVTAAVSGYLAIAYLLRYLKNHSLAIFAWYRIVLAILVWWLLV